MPEEIAVSQLRLQRMIEAVIVAISVLATAAMLIGIGLLLISGKSPAERDVVSFWAAGRQIAAHADPYDAASIFRLERATGFPEMAQPLIMRNPPSALVLVLPLAAFQLYGASLLWSVLLLASLALSVHLFWVACGRPANRIYLLGYCFGPALICILGGQTALFALLGLVLFLRLQGKHSFAAGVSLWLCALKPHLFLPFAVVLLLWVIATRRYRLIAGAALALAASSAAATWLDPSVWTQYNQMMHSPNIEAEFIPSIGFVLRNAVYPQATWIQYLPAIAACCWAIYFYRSRRETWDWIDDGALLMLVSVAASPYAWLTDQSILLPALVVGVYRAGTRAQIGVLALLSTFTEVAQFSGKSMHSAIFILLPPLWLVWYLYATRQSRSRRDRAPHAAFAEA